MLMVVSSCSINDNQGEQVTAHHDIGLYYTIQIDGKEYHYYDYIDDISDSKDLVSISLDNINSEADELIISTETFKIYSITEAIGYECLLRKRESDGIATETKMLVGFETFNSISEILLFFGINSSAMIKRCVFKRLVSTETDNDSFYYETYRVTEIPDELNSIYDLLCNSQEGELDSDKTFPINIFNDIRAESISVEDWPGRIYKLDIELVNGEQIPVGIVLPSTSSSDDGFLEILGQQQYFKANISENMYSNVANLLEGSPY